MNAARRWITWQLQKVVPDPGQSYQRVELDHVIQHEIEWSARERVLDVGCYRGESGSFIADRVRSVVAVDISAQPLSEIHHQNIVPVCGDGQTLPFAPESFDTVFCHLTANLLTRAESAATEFARCLKPSGRVILSVCNLRSPYQRLKRAMERASPDCQWATLRDSQNDWSAERWIGAFEKGDVHLRQIYSCNLSWPLIPRIRGRWIIPNRLMWGWTRAARRVSALPFRTPKPHFAAHDYILVLEKRKSCDRKCTQEWSVNLNDRSTSNCAAS